MIRFPTVLQVTYFLPHLIFLVSAVNTFTLILKDIGKVAQNSSSIKSHHCYLVIN